MGYRILLDLLLKIACKRNSFALNRSLAKTAFAAKKRNWPWNPCPKLN